ncbi:hypothetical protein ANI_1_270184 [Paecilomyces variotii No. 5]|uniref:Uncharacterized protein n=1 Tax=Byssochlamys spectabilis (strain No. 5 / NBRC 109023) TaxID=1356009 RepID=V5G0Q0_BYSSN|nr:hypothetical protein ANI_1_270184 [Paecilomyces variotii No. 5]
MSQNQKSNPSEVKTLGRSPRSLTAPLAAFTMALVLGSWCISSIRSARRDARYHLSDRDEGAVARGQGSGSEPGWLTKALEESKRK